MSSSAEQAAGRRLLTFLREWDRGSVHVRRRMLRSFLSQNTGKTSPELELEFTQAASLFLSRITVWIRLTYMFGTCLNLQLKALGVFLSAAGSRQYLMEFLEVGGVLTLLEILGQKKTKEPDKAEALRLLYIISNSGRQYKELICESYGVRAVAECLAQSKSEETQRSATTLLESLSQGNPLFQQQVYKGLIALLACNSPKAQQLVLQTLRTVQSTVKAAHPGIVGPLLNLLRSLHLEVQYEVLELIAELQQTEVRTALLRSLVTLLKPSREGARKYKILQDPEMMKMTDSLPLFVQQAAAAKALRMLAQSSQTTSEDLIHLGVVHYLLYAMGNQEHADTQRQASLTLEHIVRSDPVVEEHVHRAMGPALFTSFMNNAELLYMNMDDVEADILLSNKVNISRELEEQKVSGVRPGCMRLLSRINTMSRLKSARGERGVQEDTALVKSRKSKPRVKEEEPSRPSPYHFFDDPAELRLFRSHLLAWYDQSKRELPWRTLAATERDVNIRTYAVWVSEVMLQQTQVATVVDYYNKWMKRWPTVQKLAEASLEEVNQMWSGLGYYSRGRRLHEGAQKVVSELGGQMPRSAETLLKQLPGVGRYTAGAISSIALGQVTGAVDGNVIRVLCRVRAIGADSTSPPVTEALWTIADMLVDPDRPADFNQALMELGATVCTPKSPVCAQCPVQTHCRAYRKVSLKQEKDTKTLLGRLDSAVPDIENCLSGSCNLCLSEGWDSELGVQNYPRKPLKKAPRVERTLTCVLQRQSDEGDVQYLLIQRPSKGLLAGMWELPSMLLEEGIPEKKHRGLLSAEVQRILGTSPDEESLQHLGEVVHIFSHIHQTYVVYSASVCVHADVEREPRTCWLTDSALQEAAVSTGVKKIMKLFYESTRELKNTKNKKRKQYSEPGKEKQAKHPRKRQERAPNGGPKQLSLSQFFTSKPAGS
ncbi:A/G-specific adenine DNA glycosylase [Salminus brasiliensis]|uniref:A/G-specific adenine DNA glycosylase n=1 Tax=Salminus brasiliensis TaxID=930266 RepID=UPI003B833E19